MQLEDSAAIEADAAAIAAALGPKARVRVEIREGVPRQRLLAAINRQNDRAAVVVLPPLRDPDASLHGLLQASSTLGRDAVVRAVEDSTSLRDRARTNGLDLAKEGRALVIWIPASWTATEDTAEPDAQIRLRSAEEVLGGWLSATDLPVAVIAHGKSAGLLARSSAGVGEWKLQPVTTPAAVLPSDDAAWGSYSEAATSLRKALEHRPPPAPLTGPQLRLLVALVGLGRAPGYLLGGQIGARDLTKQLGELLRQKAGREVVDGIRRVLQARRPISKELALKIAKVPAQHGALITCCLGESGAEIDVDDGLREGLLARSKGREQPRPVDPAVHIDIANYHEGLDGAASPAAAWNRIDHWLEKTYHLGRSGPLGAARWEALERPTREFYWARARSLSMEHRRYEDAANLYQECIGKFDREDAYSWHYLGFNLDRAGVRRREAERAFRKAVEIRPDHPWYNGRLVTFLIDQARFRAAEDEWREALERMDPDGEYVAESPWLAKETHRWVVKAWLRFGEVRRAREVLDDIPEDQFTQERWYQDLRDAVEDAEEALRLGESVYPSTTRMSERWIVPREVLEAAPVDRRRRSWYPGRVAAVEGSEIHLALALPAEDPKKRRLISRTLSREEWQRHAPFAPEEGAFIFLAIYEDPADPRGMIQILAQPSHAPRFPDEEEAEALRYLRGKQ